MESFEFSLRIMRSKIFGIWYGMMLLINFIGSIIALVLQGWCLITYTCFALEAVMLILLVIALLTKEKALVTSITFMLVAWIEFPILYLVYREIIVAYFILSIIAIVVFCPKTLRNVLLAGCFIIDIAVILLADRINLPNRANNPILLGIFNTFTFDATAIASGVITHKLLQYYEVRRAQQNEAIRKVEYSVNSDPVTGLESRIAIMADLSNRMAVKGIFSVAMLSINNFGNLSESAGYEKSEQLLKLFAACLRENLEGRGIPGRYSGEKFLVIFNPDCQSEIPAIISRIRNDFERMVLERFGLSADFSSGICCTSDYPSTSELIACADKKLYDAMAAIKAL